MKKRILLWTIVCGLVICSVFLINAWQNYQGVAAIKTMSWVVAGKTYIIDPGHGGEDPGKVSISGIYEKDINLAVAKKLQILLAQGGGKVVMTRDTDRALSQGEDTIRKRKRSDLINRVKLAEEVEADIYISLHCNAFPSSRWYGAQSFYSPSVDGSKELATSIQDEIIKLLKNTTRKPKSDTTTLIFKRVRIPIVNVEMGFLSNLEEEKKLKNPDYQDKMAWAIYSGVVKYLVEYGDKYCSTISNIPKVK